MLCIKFILKILITKKYRKCANMILQEMFWKIIRVCLERYSDNLANVLVGGILISEERIREVMNLVEKI